MSKKTVHFGPHGRPLALCPMCETWHAVIRKPGSTNKSVRCRKCGTKWVMTDEEHKQVMEFYAQKRGRGRPRSNGAKAQPAPAQNAAKREQKYTKKRPTHWVDQILGVR